MDTLLKKHLIDAGYLGEFDLSSLVEACGEPFRELKHHVTSKKKWSASTAKQASGLQKFGRTPEEAVANLYLALHDKRVK